MKKLIFLFIIIFTVLTHLFAQKIYFNLGSGYNFSAAPTMPGGVGYDSTSANGTSYDNYSLIKGTGSLGQGVQIKGTIGYRLNKSISMELNASYLLGSKISNSNNNSYQTGYYNGKSTCSGEMLRLIPALKISTEDSLIKLYMKTGLVIGLFPKLKQAGKSSTLVNNHSHSSENEIDYSGGIPLGFNGTIGAILKINNRFSIYSEIDYIMQSWAPAKSKYVKYTVDTIDELSTLNVYDKETVYVDSYTPPVGSWNSIKSSPRKEIKKYFPFNSFGINIGIHVSLGK